MKPIKVFMLLYLIFSAAFCYADTVTRNAGDVLPCDILTKYFGLRSPYQDLFFIKDYISDIICAPDQSNRCTIKTINNDSFTGLLINSQIEVLMGTGPKVSLPLDTIKSVHIDTQDNTTDTTRKKETTVFVMNNGDRFSGQIITARFKNKTGPLALEINEKKIKHIVFVHYPGATCANIYLNNHSMRYGVFDEEALSINPDSTPPITIPISRFHSIEFNSPKHIQHKMTPAEYNHPKFCLFQCRSGLLTECCPSQTTAVLLPDPDGHVGKIAVQTEAGQQILSEAGQAVIVRNVKEPPPRPIFLDEDQIQGIFGKALAAEPEVPKKFNLFFKINSTNLIPDSEALIPEIIKCIKERNSSDIRVNGFSDKKGSSEYNLALSKKRAAHIQKLLAKLGIDSKYITTLSLGEVNPLIPTEDGVAELRNRRVEVIVR